MTGYAKGFIPYGILQITRGELKGMEWQMAHNQILELFMQGGLVLFLVFSFIIIVIVYKNRECSESTLLARWLLFVLLFSYLTEAFLNSITFAILIIIYSSSRLIQNQ